MLVLLQGWPCALWSWGASAAAGCRCRVLLRDADGRVHLLVLLVLVLVLLQGARCVCCCQVFMEPAFWCRCRSLQGAAAKCLWSAGAGIMRLIGDEQLG